MQHLTKGAQFDAVSRNRQQRATERQVYTSAPGRREPRVRGNA
jgi:hypothetical protein